MNRHGTLTDDDVQWAIDYALGNVENRWIERRLQACATDADAVRSVSSILGAFGCFGGGRAIDSSGVHDGPSRTLRVRVWVDAADHGRQPDRQGYVPYDEIVAEARRTRTVQTSLF